MKDFRYLDEVEQNAIQYQARTKGQSLDGKGSRGTVVAGICSSIGWEPSYRSRGISCEEVKAEKV